MINRYFKTKIWLGFLDLRFHFPHQTVQKSPHVHKFLGSKTLNEWSFGSKPRRQLILKISKLGWFWEDLWKISQDIIYFFWLNQLITLFNYQFYVNIYKFSFEILMLGKEQKGLIKRRNDQFLFWDHLFFASYVSDILSFEG